MELEELWPRYTAAVSPQCPYHSSLVTGGFQLSVWWSTEPVRRVLTHVFGLFCSLTQIKWIKVTSVFLFSKAKSIQYRNNPEFIGINL